jgi:hypothetical protein
MWRKLLIWLCLPLLITPAAVADAAVPAQFIAKIYSEALGRAPDPKGWLAAVRYFQAAGCSRRTLEAWGGAAFASAEFRALHYDDAAMTLIAYRAILNREPDPSGYAHWYVTLEDGANRSTVVADLFKSREFALLVPYLCGGGSYSFGTLGTGPAIEIPMIHAGGYSHLSQTELQNLLYSTAAGDTVYLQQESVVYLTRPLLIPAGVTLATAGLPDPPHHALMARLVRNAPFAAPMVEINADDSPNPSGSLRSIWVDGQRATATPYVSAAIDVEIYGGDGATVASSFLTGSLGWSTLHSYGLLDGRPCAGNRILRNVITAYSSVHTNQTWTDGISVSCEHSVVEENQIVDATDVGVVVFNAYPENQQSQVIDNTVVNAGNSAFAALAFDPLQDRSADDPNFTGSSISDNTLWSGPYAHFIIGIAVGTRPWYPRGAIGTGARAVGNTTAGVPTHFGAEIVVSGMLNATVQGNVFNDVPIKPRVTACPIGAVLASISAGLASGSIQAHSDRTVNGCMSDNSQEFPMPHRPRLGRRY